MSKSHTETICGLSLTFKYEVEPGERQTYTEPGWPTLVTVTGVYMDGHDVDLIDIISPTVLQRIEARLASGYADMQDDLRAEARELAYDALL